MDHLPVPSCLLQKIANWGSGVDSRSAWISLGLFGLLVKQKKGVQRCVFMHLLTWGLHGMHAGSFFFFLLYSGWQLFFLWKGRGIWLYSLSLFNQAALWSVECLGCSIFGGQSMRPVWILSTKKPRSVRPGDLGALLIELLRHHF